MSRQGEISKVTSNAISNYVGQVYSMLITLASVPVYIKYLGTEAYGLIGFFILLQSLIVILDFGLSATLNRQIAHARAAVNEFKPLFNVLKTIEFLFVIVSISIILAIHFNSNFMSGEWIKPVTLDQADVAYCLKLMGVIIGLKLYSTFYRSGINGFEDQVWNNKNIIIINTLKYGGSIIILIYISQKITIYFEYQLLAAILETWSLRHRFYKNMPKSVANYKSKKTDWHEVFKIAPFALSIAYTSAVVIVIMQLDKLLLSTTISLEELGYLNVISTVTSLILVMTTPVFSAYLPKITMLATNKNISEMTVVYTEMTKIVALITVISSAMIACNSKGIIYAITGNKVAEMWGAEVLIYYAIGTGFYVLGSVQYYLLNALGNLKLYVAGCSISLLVLIPIVFWGVKKYSVLGASYIWMIYGFVWFIVWGGFVHKKMLPKFHLKWLLKEILPLMISVGVATIIASSELNINENSSRTLIVLEGLILGIFILLINALWLNGFRRFIMMKINFCEITNI